MKAKYFNNGEIITLHWLTGYIQLLKNEILVLNTKHFTSICSFSWQYTPNFNCFYLYKITQIQFNWIVSNQIRKVILIFEYTIFNVDFMCATTVELIKEKISIKVREVMSPWKNKDCDVKAHTFDVHWHYCINLQYFLILNIYKLKKCGDMTILHSIFWRHWSMICEFETYYIFLKVSLNLANVDNVYLFNC